MINQFVIKSFLWLIAIICLFVGMYVAINHSHQLLLDYNYSLAPLGDQAQDMAQVIYPILTSEKSWNYLFMPFADHRIVIERLLIMYDFFVHQGLESGHPYRVVSVFWSIFVLFSGIIFLIKKIPLFVKLLIIGCAATLIFAGVSVSNFFLTICFTWPLVMLFSLLSFITVSYYCYAYEHNQSTFALIGLLFTSILIVLTLFTFNIGLILWPIIFIVLFKRKVWRRHILLWTGMAALSYVAYFWSGWHPGVTATDQGLKNSIFNPIHPFLFMSRILSIPLISNASTTVTLGVILIGVAISLFSMVFLIKYWKLKRWTASDTVIFSYLLFCFASLVIISIMRSWIVGEYAEVGGRFVTSSLVLWLCLLASICIFYYRSKTHSYGIMSCLLLSVIFIWLVVFFIPADRGVYNASVSNQHAIALSTQIPVNKAFIDYSKTYANGDENTADHIYIDQVYRKYQKGIYTLWPAKQVNRSLNEMRFSLLPLCPSDDVIITSDLRTKGNPAVFIQTRFPTSWQLMQWNLIFTDQSSKIVGYSLPLVNTEEDLWKRFFHFKQAKKPQIWQGVINSSLIRGHSIQTWLVNYQNKTMCKTNTFII